MKGDLSGQALYAPNTVYLEVTNKCNLKCKHCYSMANEDGYELPLNEIKALFKRLDEIGTFGVVLGGGEPLMREDIVHIINLANKYNLLVGLSTNGILVNKEFLKNTRDKISNIQISLDGHTDEEHERLRNKKGIFKDTLQAIKLLSDNNFHVTVSTVITNDNVNYIDKIIEIALENGAKTYRATKLIKSGNALKNNLDIVDFKFISKYLEELKEKYSKEIDIEIDSEFYDNKSFCTAGKETIAINYKGDVYFCAFLSNPKFICGNIMEKDIHNIWLNSRKLKEIRQLDKILNCKECENNNNNCFSNCKAMLLNNCSKLDSYDF
ncbi:radical SAM/SPASM domain-containing protein [Sporosalibacterium faouarense]|uniref:radical SAM/SPASM domain-containing protein n=1 Tax=Sporosalibacterium faouarense TaxID=516123 RepID=UPI00141CAC70|nr:radical SAM protein [Sporosalibacterium faouarense]MTI49646.1 radical SAM protein [Bacillota bacterium]